MAQVTFVERGSTITTGGAAQQVMAQNLNRKYLLFQNVSTNNMWIRFGVGNASNSQPSLLILPNGSYEMNGVAAVGNTDRLSGWGTATADPFSCVDTP